MSRSMSRREALWSTVGFAATVVTGCSGDDSPSSTTSTTGLGETDVRTTPPADDPAVVPDDPAALPDEGSVDAEGSEPETTVGGREAIGIAVWQSQAGNVRPSDYPDHAASISGWVVEVRWDEMETEPGVLAPGNPLERALAEAEAGGWWVKARVLFGWYPPPWALELPRRRRHRAPRQHDEPGSRSGPNDARPLARGHPAGVRIVHRSTGPSVRPAPQSGGRDELGGDHVMERERCVPARGRARRRAGQRGQVVGGRLHRGGARRGGEDVVRSACRLQPDVDRVRGHAVAARS